MLDRSNLHANQLPAIDHLRDHDREALWAPMGFGKSVCTLTALDDLAAVETNVWPALFLGPKRVARSVWPSAPSEWSHLQHLRIVDATGDLETRKRALRSKHHGVSINFEQLEWLVDAYGDDWPFKTVIADELNSPGWVPSAPRDEARQGARQGRSHQGRAIYQPDWNAGAQRAQRAMGADLFS